MVWVRYKNYAGIILRGTVPVAIPKGDKKYNHLSRAFYLTSQLESPTWGTVQSYDGCGISAGPYHFIACNPSTCVQGFLFEFINYVRSSINDKNVNLSSLVNELIKCGWYLTSKGLVDNNNKLISGIDIRNVFAPINGVVPASGKSREQADKWALLFHTLLSDPITYRAQEEYAVNYLCKGYQSKEKEIYDIAMNKNNYSLSDLQVGLDINKLSFEADLVMCLYHSASVNAPGIAIKSLVKTDRKNLPKQIIRNIATTNYGNWNCNLKNSRYSHAREIVKKSGLWPNSLFEQKGVMPEKF